MKVSLIGDSIRMNSEQYALKSLPHYFEIYSPNENCESSILVSEKIDNWVNKNSSIVHLNCGLHDIRYNPNHNKPVTNLSQYLANLEIIFSYLSNLDKIVIWATSTPFIENTHNRTKDSKRFFSDLALYNQESIELAKSYSFQINDLFGKLLNMNYSVNVWASAH